MSEVVYSVEAGVARITINRPEQRNALDPGALLGLRAALAAAEQDAAVRVVTLTGSGDRVFSAGADLKASAAGGFGRGDFRSLLLDLVRFPKPTVALARGHVMAGGLGLLLACDLALACDDVHFSTPEIQVGMFPMMVLALLYRHVGRKKATEMILLGERVQAAEAAACGLVNRIYPRTEFDRAAAELAGKLASRSLEIVRLGKEAMREAEGRPLADALEYLEGALGRVMATEDSREGIRAFLEKRTPGWKDR